MPNHSPSTTVAMQQLSEAASYIRTRFSGSPDICIILGSGLGNLTHELEDSVSIPYGDIPHFPVSTVEGHGGELMFGRLGSKTVAVLSGRFHFYEGYTPQQVVFPIRVMRLLGVHTLLISNAAGGMNLAFKVGDLMIIRDHISLFVANPLLGPNDPSLGTRFPDMSEPYSLDLIEKARIITQKLGIPVSEGVYCGVTGPTFETRAEYRLLHLVGGDAVGMSTVQEVIAAVHAGMRVFAMSVITDLGIREEANTITHQEVLEAAAAAEPKLTAIFSGLVRAL
jgi:purine-nucleoside phosphorylase